ncbi:hypothetical protein [Streptomyces rubiginosohelvolus]|uniref:hypothetical protein n=1 Tax=Streptomyces rubiginosohelvolus TaxID=67362 RepID=UPI00380BC839
MSTSSQTLRQQGAPVLLLASLYQERPDLPAAEVRVSRIYTGRLELALHGDLLAFEAWRTALGLSEPRVHDFTGLMWVSVEERVDDVPVKLVGYSSRSAVAEYAQVHGIPLPGELAEQRHLVDPLDGRWAP